MDSIISFGDASAILTHIRVTGSHEADSLAAEYDALCRLMPDRPHRILAFEVPDWNRDLSPWHADAVYGDTPFGGEADKTLGKLLALLPKDGTKTALVGYSLAGLFALWAAYETDAFDGAAAVSPSVWFPSFAGYADTHDIRCGAVYLSLGKKEEKVRHPILQTVGDALRAEYERLEAKGVPCTLEWNEGNHFNDCTGRVVKGMVWLENTLITEV